MVLDHGCGMLSASTVAARVATSTERHPEVSRRWLRTLAVTGFAAMVMLAWQARGPLWRAPMAPCSAGLER